MFNYGLTVRGVVSYITCLHVEEIRDDRRQAEVNEVSSPLPGGFRVHSRDAAVHGRRYGDVLQRGDRRQRLRVVLVLHLARAGAPSVAVH